MFNQAEVRSVLFGRVGWKEPKNQSPYPLSDTNKESRSGRYFQGFHSIVTLNNILHAIENEDADEEAYNEYLENIQASAILNSLSGIFNENTLIEQTLLFNRNADKSTYLISNTGKKVGYRINVAQEFSYCVVLKSISLLFRDSGTIKLVLEHNTAGEIFSTEINVTAGVETVVDIGETLYYSCEKYKGGFFYLYYESDLTPIEFDIPTFNKTYLFGARPFEATDLNNLSETDKTYGLNVELCAYRDFTEVVRKNDHLFDNLIGMQVAASVIDLIMNSTRSNMNERITGEKVNRLYNDLNLAYSSPEFPYTTGIRNQISREIKRLKENLLPKQKPGINTPCFT